MKDITKEYVDMLESFEADYNLLLNDSFGIRYMNQVITRIKNKEKLTKKDLKLLEDLGLLKKLVYDLNHGFVKIMKID